MNAGVPGPLRALGDDPAVRATAASRIVALAGAPVTLYLAAVHLDPRAQGFFVVALNVVALAQLFELGLGTTLVQFASHEWPHLRWGRGGGLEGNPAARDAVAALALAALRWFGRAAIALFLIAGIGGALLFRGGFAGTSLEFWVLWCGTVALAALYLLIIPFLCITEGCGDIVSLQWMRTTQAAAVLVALWIGILFAGALVATWMAAAAQLVVAGAWLLRRHRGLLRAPRTLPATLMDSAKGLAARYRVAQGRSAQLWLALHLAPQLLAPIALRIRGGDDAGRLGLTLAIALAPATIAVAWLHARYPAFGALAAERKLADLGALARRATLQAAGAFAACALAVTAVVLVLPYALPRVSMRLLPLGGLLLLFIGALASVLQQAMAGYLRAHRDESIAPWVAGGAAVVVVSSATAAWAGGVPAEVMTYAGASIVALAVSAAWFARARARLATS